MDRDLKRRIKNGGAEPDERRPRVNNDADAGQNGLVLNVIQLPRSAKVFTSSGQTAMLVFVCGRFTSNRAPTEIQRL